MRTIFLFLSGTFVGVLAGLLLLAAPMKRQYENQYVINVLDQAYIALRLSRGEADALHAEIADQLPEYAQEIQDRFPDSPLAPVALWMVRSYYERTGLPFPESVDALLSDLPTPIPATIQTRLQHLDQETAAPAEP